MTISKLLDGISKEDLDNLKASLYEGNIKLVQNSIFLAINEILDSKNSIDLKIEAIKLLLEDETVEISHEFFKGDEKTISMSGFLFGSPKTNKLKTEDKFGAFIRFLIENEIDFSKLKFYKETLPKETLPKETLPKETLPKETLPKKTLPKKTLPKNSDIGEPYKLIQIKTKGIEKTILLSDEFGKLTYIYDGLLDENDFKGVKKGSKIKKTSVIEVSYGSDYIEALGKNILLNKKSVKVSGKKETLNSKLIQKIVTLESGGIKKTYLYYYNLKGEEFSDFNIDGIKKQKLRSESGIEIEGNMQTHNGFMEWIDKVYKAYGIENPKVFLEKDNERAFMLQAKK